MNGPRPSRAYVVQSRPMAASSPSSRTSVRRELLLPLGILFFAGFLLALVALALVLPLLNSPGQVAGYMAVILAADLTVLFLYGRRLVDRILLRPLDRIMAGAERVAAGEYEHRIPREDSDEMGRLVESVNRMAERLVEDRKRLAENVRSLDEANRELVETTDQLVRTARLASVGTMASGIAHEVGNPLGALMGYLDVAESRARSGRPEGAAEACGHARSEAQRIDRIVRSLLAFTRPGSEDGSGSDGIRVEEVVQRVLDLSEAQGLTGSLRVQWECQEDLPPVGGEPQHLEQVLVNLLVNARDALADREDGTVRLSAWSRPWRGRLEPRRRADDPSDADYTHRRRGESLRKGDRLARVGRVVCVQVEDDGPGIPEDLLPALFDPFVTSKEPGEGMGLGLAISARMVQELGGRIEGENRPEGGARFLLVLPAADGGSEDGRDPAQSETVSGEGR